ncbi:MAG: hypothetical protein EAY81_06815 [Bacteroidetes bacterium]|nr:MAG: hypothetical protein EAY81_06815 [Bacteroidota bacterium]
MLPLPHAFNQPVCIFRGSKYGSCTAASNCKINHQCPR